jgi:ATP-dependent Clp protease ATP-binding subunit ClpA
VIQKRIQDPLALRMLEGEVRDGTDLVADAEGGRITFRVAEAVGAGA